jgi:hypothetical protein
MRSALVTDNTGYLAVGVEVVVLGLSVSIALPGPPAIYQLRTKIVAGPTGVLLIATTDEKNRS